MKNLLLLVPVALVTLVVFLLPENDAPQANTLQGTVASALTTGASSQRPVAIEGGARKVKVGRPVGVASATSAERSV